MSTPPLPLPYAAGTSGTARATFSTSCSTKNHLPLPADDAVFAAAGASGTAKATSSTCCWALRSCSTTGARPPALPSLPSCLPRKPPRCSPLAAGPSPCPCLLPCTCCWAQRLCWMTGARPPSLYPAGHGCQLSPVSRPASWQRRSVYLRTCGCGRHWGRRPAAPRLMLASPTTRAGCDPTQLHATSYFHPPNHTCLPTQEPVQGVAQGG